MCSSVLVTVAQNPRMRPIWFFFLFLLLVMIAVVGASPWKRDVNQVSHNSIRFGVDKLSSSEGERHKPSCGGREGFGEKRQKLGNSQGRSHKGGEPAKILFQQKL